MPLYVSCRLQLAESTRQEKADTTAAPWGSSSAEEIEELRGAVLRLEEELREGGEVRERLRELVEEGGQERERLRRQVEDVAQVRCSADIEFLLRAPLVKNGSF